MKVSRLSVVGLGKLGLCIAAVLAYRGYKVIGVDVDYEKVRAVNLAKSPIQETGLDMLLKRSRKRLSATTDYKEAIKETEATFVIVPTPSEPDGTFSLKYVKDAMGEIAKVLASKFGYHLIVLNSTVMPGSMEGHVKPLLEEYSGKRCGEDFGLCYNPLFVALGDVIRGVIEPDLILIGESDRRAGLLLSKIYRKVCTNKPPIESTSFINAEIAKIAINSFITVKISFANTLAELCERTPGANVDVVTKIMGRDSRIGPKYIKGGLGYGGPCFPRDNIAFSRFAELVGAKADIPLAAHQLNLQQSERVIRFIEKLSITPNSRISILGLSYKPGTPVIDESQSIYLAKGLKARGYEVHVYDPSAMDAARHVLKDSVIYEDSVEKCVANCEVLIIATAWPEFKTLDSNERIVIDCWRIIDPKKRGTKYFALGVGPT